LAQIRILQEGLQSVPHAWIAFEFAIPRMGKRADVVILLDGIVFVVEFKVDADTFPCRVPRAKLDKLRAEKRVPAPSRQTDLH
jgi:hypothetical protein